MLFPEGRELCPLHVLGVWLQLLTDHRGTGWCVLLLDMEEAIIEINCGLLCILLQKKEKKTQFLNLICCHSFVVFLFFP